MQEPLYNLPLNEKDALRKAHMIIREYFGTIPSPGKPIFQDKIWKIPINVRYPRVLYKIDNLPKKVRFMNFGKVGEISMNSETGELIDKPWFYDVQNEIRKNLDNVSIAVEQALVKSEANLFSKIPFPSHMKTPILDILSWMILRDRMDLTTLEFESFDEDTRQKYLRNISELEETGLLHISENIVEPGPILIEIEARRDIPESKKLGSALAVFFERGYGFIESVRQVLGPHLIICSFCYQISLEQDEVVPLSYETINSIYSGFYPYETQKIKLPRYLLQLEQVELLGCDTISGNQVWMSKEPILTRIKQEEEILEPLFNVLADNT
jgi:hypothetical protein